MLGSLADPRWRYTQQQRLAAVPLFPLDPGTIALYSARVFLPPKFTPPALTVEVRLLQEERRWGQFYDHLGIVEIDAWGYLNKALLPVLPELAHNERHRALEWLRDHWSQLTGRTGWDEL